MDINGLKFLTITAAKNEVYAITYKNHSRISILNITTDDILINSEKTFEGNKYFTLPPAIALNELSIPNGTIYIKAKASGKISIARCSD